MMWRSTYTLNTRKARSFCDPREIDHKDQHTQEKYTNELDLMTLIYLIYLINILNVLNDINIPEILDDIDILNIRNKINILD